MRRGSNPILIAGICLALVVSGVAGILWFASSITGEGPEVPAADLAPIRVPSPLPTASVIVPASNQQVTLPDSDELVRSLGAELSKHPRLAGWLLNDRLVRRFVAATVAVAGGYSPRDELDFLQPARPFYVLADEGDALVIAPGSYHRYDAATDVFASLDTAGLMRIFDELEAELDRAHRDLSWRDIDFEQSLREAIDHLLEVEIPSGSIEVERRVLTYSFADGSLERLSDAQRQLLRMGPENARTVQSKLRELRAAFGWPGPQAAAATTPEIAESDSQANPSETAVLVDVAGEEQQLSANVHPLGELEDIAIWGAGLAVEDQDPQSFDWTASDLITTDR
jgi:hypothetical protein